LQDGTVLFTSNEAAVRAVLEVEEGRAPALADRPDVATLLSGAPPDFVSALLLSGAALRVELATVELNPRLRPQDVERIRTALTRSGPLPPVRLALFGLTGGGPLLQPLRGTPYPEAPNQPRARAGIALLMADEVTAAAAAPVVAERLATLPSAVNAVPYAEYYPERNVAVAPGLPVVLIDLGTGDRHPRILFDMVFNNDLLFLAWE
jgi:hypothetical protein